MAHGLNHLFAQVPQTDDGLANTLFIKQMKLVEEEWLAGHIDHALGLGSGDVSEASGKTAGQDDDW
jgi:hypothetical protein